MSNADGAKSGTRTLHSLAALRAALGDRELPSGPAAAPSGPNAPTVKIITAQLVVRRERAGHGGKTVTIAEGPALAGRDLDEFARSAAKALGVGAHIDASTLVVQGDQTDRLIAWFTKRGFVSVTRGN
ncbi:MAG: translation initiation factor [Planctomycetes bacterium]|nr:translation initiation factor [Planctomycetota bacterium]